MPVDVFCRLSWVSVACQTRPMPPSPMRAVTSSCPKRLPTSAASWSTPVSVEFGH